MRIEAKERTCPRACFYDFCRKTLAFIAGAICLAQFMVNFIWNTRVSYDSLEKVSIDYHFLESLIVVAVWIGVVLVCRAAYTRWKFPEDQEKKLFLVLAVIYTIMAFFLIFNADHTKRADARFVYRAAVHIMNEEYFDFAADGYISRYPNQLGLLAYDSLLLRLSENEAIYYLVNCIFVLGINYGCFCISDELFQDKTVNCITIFLSFLFFPHFFFIMFAYGLIPGLFFLIWAFYFGLRFTKNECMWTLALCCFCMGAAVLLKMNNLIGVIALAIFFVLKLLQSKKKWKMLFGVLLMCSVLVLPGKLVTSYYENKTGFQLDGGTPSILWVAMGTDIDNRERGPGWWDGTNQSLFQEAGNDTQTASMLGKEKLQNNLVKIKADPGKALRFFRDKIVSQWCDPMYQSVWSGPLEDCGQFTHHPLLQSIYNGGWVENIIAIFCKLMTMTIWGCGFFYLLYHGRNQFGWELLFLFTIGGFLFHIFWEAKSQYAYPYVFILIPFSAYMIKQIFAINQKK